MRAFVWGAGLVFALDGALNAQTSALSTAPDPITVTGKLPDGQKKVCHTDAQTGSILVKRVCKTKQEWEDIRVRSVAALERRKEQDETDAQTRAMRQE